MYPVGISESLRDLLSNILKKTKLKDSLSNTIESSMGNENQEKIVVTELDKVGAISTFPSAFATTKIQIIFKRKLK